MVGGLDSLTVIVVAVAAVSVPAAPLLSVTVLFAAVVSNPKPLMVSVALRGEISVTELVTTGSTVATCTGVPLTTPFDATIAVNTPALGLALSVIVREVAVDELTVPTAPLLKITVLWLGVVLKPVPAIVTVVALAARLVSLNETVGAVDVATTCAS